MALVVRLLNANVTNVNTNTVLYSASATGLGAIVRNVRLVNTGAAAVTVNLFFTPSGGGQIRILDRDLSVPVNEWAIVSSELTMGPSDKIEVTTSAAMDYVVSGVEKA